MPWSPLARGFLAGNRALADKSEHGATDRANTDESALKFYYTEADFTVVEALGKAAVARGVSNATVAYAWLLAQPGVCCPIVGSSRPEQLDDVLAAIDFALSAEEDTALKAAYRPHPVLGHT